MTDRDYTIPRVEAMLGVGPSMWLGLWYSPGGLEEVLGVFSTRARAEEWCRYHEATRLPRGIRDRAIQQFRVDGGAPGDIEFLEPL